MCSILLMPARRASEFLIKCRKNSSTQGPVADFRFLPVEQRRQTWTVRPISIRPEFVPTPTVGLRTIIFIWLIFGVCLRVRAAGEVGGVRRKAATSTIHEHAKLSPELVFIQADYCRPSGNQIRHSGPLSKNSIVGKWTRESFRRP
jgi:hypothetical protein